MPGIGAVEPADPESGVRDRRTCGGAGFVGAVGAVAVVVVDAGEGDGDGGMREAGECVCRGVVVEFCVCRGVRWCAGGEL